MTHKEFIEKYYQETNPEIKKQIANVYRKQRYQAIIKYLNDMEPFENIDDIPDIPVFDTMEEYEKYVVKNFIRCGAIPKYKLIKDKKYLGKCRNADEAIWNGNKFIYKRNKFGFIYEEEINHFEDEDGTDLFVPLKLIEN